MKHWEWCIKSKVARFVMGLFETGIRPVIDKWIADKAEEKRDYGEYWSASSGGYCMRKQIFERLGVPPTNEDARKQRVFSAGDIFHKWLQDITKEAGLSIAQELELQDEDLMIRGHIDDLILVGSDFTDANEFRVVRHGDPHLILYDYKSAHSRSFHYAKNRPISYYHKMQVGTYMHMLRTVVATDPKKIGTPNKSFSLPFKDLTEARVLKISKDDLCMLEHQVLWTKELEKEVLDYWKSLNEAWRDYQYGGVNSMDPGPLPPCTCADHEGGFMAKEAYNPFFYNDEPCSLEYLKKWQKEQKSGN